jgi:hypothetical protein
LSDEAKPKDRSRLAIAGLLLCAVPLVAVIELVLHVKQTTSDVVPESDWAGARDAVKAELQPNDLVLFEPFWADPLGRRTFGHEIATMKREGRSDVRRFARAFEVSIRGAHATDELAGWKKVKETKHGAVTVTLLENPSYTPVIDDLLDLVGPDRLTVSRVENGVEQACSFQRAASQGGSTVVPQGLLVPADRFVCQGGHVGVSVLHGLDHHPHVCLYATPMQGASLRMKFSNVTFGPSLHGHSGIQWLVERNPTPDKVAVTFSALDRLIGTHFHKVGVGWVGFELPTPELDGKKADLVAEIAPSSQRQFCFEATTRREVSR